MATSSSASSAAPKVPAKRVTLAEKNRQLAETLEMVENDRERIVEALGNAVLMLRQEDIGWASPGKSGEYRGLDLDELKKWSGEIRASLTGTREKAPNPHMRNGLMLRHSFIWQGGIKYEGVPGSKDAPARQGKVNVYDLMNEPGPQRLVFGSTARRKREHALFSDGLYIVVGNNRDKKDIRPIPLHEITDTQRDELYEDEIVAYRWTRNEAVRRRSGKRGVPSILTGEREEKSYWVYVDWYTGYKPQYIDYNGKLEKVLSNHTAFDLHANRPEGQPFGSPDAISALVWARVIRDLIMNGVKMQDALAMFAFKATAPTKEGQQQMALELAKASGGGNAASGTTEQDLVPLNSAGRGYDFGSIGFVVATMAASLHLSGIALSANTALAGSSYGAAKTLDLPGRMAMETRRAEHIEFDMRLLRWYGANDASAYFDNYDDATDEYRSMQTAYLLWQSGNITPEGFVAEVENIYGRKLIGGIPNGVITPNNQKQIDDAAKAAEKAAAAKSAAAPTQGKGDGTGGAEHANDPQSTK